MSDNLLYFISIIARALQSPDVDKALRNAFCEIKKKGRQKQYAEGFNNFKLFMDAVCSSHEAVTNDYIRELIVELAIGTFEGTEQEKELLLNLINSRPEWKADYEALCHTETHEDLTQDCPVIAVLSEKGLIKEITFTKVSGCESIDNIVPGNYKLELTNTGWIIWEGQITAKKLIWSEAHKGEDLPLAAGAEKPTGEINLLDNKELMLRTYAGIESGSIKIELKRQEGFKNE